MTSRAVAAALVLLVGCGVGTQTERGPVSLADGQVSQVGPQELVVDVPSCNGDPEVDELVEDDGEVRIRVVTTMVVSGDRDSCADSLEVALQQPLGDRDVIDAESGGTLRVVELDTDPGSLAGLCEDMDLSVAEDEPGLDTVEDAIDAFVASGGEFLANATFQGQQIRYEGEVVGRMSVRSMPAGGYLVTSAEWCYPDDY
ncbi:MAG: hypothetical protein ABR616_01745 [Dermatophilaceae bacterium]